MLCGISEAQKLAPGPNKVQTVRSKLPIVMILNQHRLCPLNEQYRSEVHRQQLPWPSICPYAMPLQQPLLLAIDWDK